MNIQLKDQYIIFEVKSDSRDLTHEVIFNRATGEWSCTCEDYWYRKRTCKHTRQAINFMEDLFQETLNGTGVYVGRTLTSDDIACMEM